MASLHFGSSKTSYVYSTSFRFLNTHLLANPRPVLDSEVDLVTGPREEVHPVPPEDQRVFPTEPQIPADAINARVDQEFVPIAQVPIPSAGSFAPWRSELLSKLRHWTFHHFPTRPPAPRFQPALAAMPAS